MHENKRMDVIEEKLNGGKCVKVSKNQQLNMKAFWRNFVYFTFLLVKIFC